MTAQNPRPIAGAALPKDTRAVRKSIRGQVKHVCRHFPACDGSGYFTAAQAREGRIPACYAHPGAGPMVPANPAACLELRPDLVDVHPDAAEMARLAHAGAERWKGEPCASCGEPPGDDRWHPDCWYCYRCGGVNERHPDGTLGWFRAGPRSPEAEMARGMRADAACRSRVTVARRAPERVQPGTPAPGGDAMPF